MKKPYLEIVRFGAEDVIATSGGAGATGADSAPSVGGLTGSYYTMRTEWQDAYNNSLANMDPSEYPSYGWYSFKLNGNNYAEVTSLKFSQPSSGKYAWFNNGTWYSNNELYNASISPKPEGYDS